MCVLVCVYGTLEKLSVNIKKLRREEMQFEGVGKSYNWELNREKDQNGLERGLGVLKRELQGMCVAVVRVGTK